MNATAFAPRSAAPQALVSRSTRALVAAVVAAAVGLAWMAAGQASHGAVDSATAALSPTVTRITLPSVEIVGKRETSDVVRIARAAEGS